VQKRGSRGWVRAVRGNYWFGAGILFGRKSERNRFVSDLSKKYDVIFFRNNWLNGFIYRMFFSSFEWFVLVFGFVFCLFLLKNALFFRIMILKYVAPAFSPWDLRPGSKTKNTFCDGCHDQPDSGEETIGVKPK